MLCKVLLATIAVLLFGRIAFADTTGTLTGNLLDGQSQHPVADALVTVFSDSQRTQTRTDARGFFVFVSLAPGTYTLTVQKNGYAPVSLAGIPVMSGHSQSIGVLRVPVNLREISVDVFSRPSDLVQQGKGQYVWRFSMARNTMLYSGPTANRMLLQTVPGVTLAPMSAQRQ